MIPEPYDTSRLLRVKGRGSECPGGGGGGTLILNGYRLLNGRAELKR